MTRRPSLGWVAPDFEKRAPATLHLACGEIPPGGGRRQGAQIARFGRRHARGPDPPHVLPSRPTTTAGSSARRPAVKIVSPHHRRAASGSVHAAP